MKWLMMLLVLVAIGCTAEGTWEFDETIERGNLGYVQFEVDGMPCLMVGRATTDESKSVWNFDGVTCDWSWKKKCPEYSSEPLPECDKECFLETIRKIHDRMGEEPK